MLTRLVLIAAFLVSGIQSTGAVEVRRVYQGTDDVALVFLHGLAGHWETSFTHPDTEVSWFDLIRGVEDVRRAGRIGVGFHIYSVDYHDAFEANTTIDEIATQITDRSDFNSLFFDHNHIFFVAHSMGGLILKRALIQIQQRGQNRYLNRIIGTAMLGVPSEGSSLADLAEETGSIGRFFASWLGVDWSQINDMRTVEAGNSFLLQLQGDWAELVDRRRQSGFPFLVACAYEKKPEASLLGEELWIVSRLYANSTCSGRAFPLNVTHTQLPKPVDSNASSHDWLLGNISRALRQLQAAEIVKRPSWMSLGLLLDVIGQERLYVDAATGLPGTDEDISLRDDSVRNLQLKEQEYHAPTYADLLMRIAKDHGCMSLLVDNRRRTIDLWVEGELACGDGSRGTIACDMEQCPEK